MPTLYEATRDEIETQLNAVTGIGKVYDSPKFATDWKEWLDLHKAADGKIKVVWFSLESVTENPRGDLGSTEIDDFINYTERTEVWAIEQYYGFKDDESAPSDYTFQLLVEAIETKFRFLQTLNGKCHFSFPLNRTFSGLFMLGNVVLSHKAEFKLKLLHRIQNPATE